MSEEKEKYRERFLLYCEGVGNLVTGPIYKAMGVSFVSGIAGALAAYLMTVIGDEYNEKYLEMELVTEKMTEACSGELNQLFLNAKRILIPGANDVCAAYETQIVNLKQAANSAARWVVGYLLSAFSAVFYKPSVGLAKDLLNRDYRLSQAKDALYAMMTSLDKAVCYVAEKFERMFQACGAKEQVDDFLGPSLLKSNLKF